MSPSCGLKEDLAGFDLPRASRHSSMLTSDNGGASTDLSLISWLT